MVTLRIVQKALIGFIVVSLFLVLASFLSNTAFAQQSTADRTALIRQLQDTIAALQAQLKELDTSEDDTTDSDTETARCVDLGEKNMSLGSIDLVTDGRVTKLQQFLRETGHYTYGVTTGFFGPATERAVQSWQRENGIVMSGTPETTGYGVVGPTTRQLMERDCTGQATPGSIVDSDQKIQIIQPRAGSVLPTDKVQKVSWNVSEELLKSLPDDFYLSVFLYYVKRGSVEGERTGAIGDGHRYQNGSVQWNLPALSEAKKLEGNEYKILIQLEAFPRDSARLCAVSDRKDCGPTESDRAIMMKYKLKGESDWFKIASRNAINEIDADETPRENTVKSSAENEIVEAEYFLDRAKDAYDAIKDTNPSATIEDLLDDAVNRLGKAKNSFARSAFDLATQYAQLAKDFAEDALELSESTELRDNNEDFELNILTKNPTQISDGKLKISLMLPRKYDGHYVLFKQNPMDTSVGMAGVSSGDFYGTTYRHNPRKPLTVTLDVSRAHEGFKNNSGGLHWFELPSGKYQYVIVVYPKSPFKPGTDMEYMDIGKEPPAVLIINNDDQLFQIVNSNDEVNAPTIESVVASPASIRSGMSSTITIRQSLANQCTVNRINPDDSATVVTQFKNMESNLPRFTVNPTQTTTYKIYCTSINGIAEESVTVTVMSNASSSGTADLKVNGSDGPLTLGLNEKVRLSWTTSGMRSCSLGNVNETPSDGRDTVVSSVPLNGSMEAYYTGNNAVIWLTCFKLTDGNSSSGGDGVYLTYAPTNTGGSSSTTFATRGDSTPPVRSNGYPTDPVPPVTSVRIGLATNEVAHCKYSERRNDDYSQMVDFTVTDSTQHNSLISVVPGATVQRYVKCADTTGNRNSDDYVITIVTSGLVSFEISNSAPQGANIAIVMRSNRSAVAGDWVAFAPRGKNWVSGLPWGFVPAGERTVEYFLITPSAPGMYDIVYYSAGNPSGSNEIARKSSAIEVGSNSEAVTIGFDRSTQLSSYPEPKVTGVVSWYVNRDGSVGTKDWIAIVPKGEKWATGMPWVYTGDNKSGSKTIDFPLVPGEYEIVYYMNDKPEELGRSNFSVNVQGKVSQNLDPRLNNLANTLTALKQMLNR